MLLRDILSAKGSMVYAIGPSATLQDVVQRLVEHNIGSLVVCEDGSCENPVLGIITERDILRASAAGHAPLASTLVADVMATELITGAPGGLVEEIMGLMTRNRIRHMPVLEEGKLVGLVSIGDVVKAQHDRLAMENHFMKDYIRS
jgi:CBS domain-containing protein